MTKVAKTAPDFLMGAEADVAPTRGELSEAMALARMQLTLEGELAELEARVSAKAEELRKVREDDLPSLMKGIGMDSFTLDTGESVTIKKDVYPSIRAAMINQAVEWFDANSLGHVVKDEVKIELGRGQQKLAEKFQKLALRLKVSMVEKLSVNAQTLKSLVKEQREKGVVFPEEIFSIFDKDTSVIKPPKKSKKK